MTFRRNARPRPEMPGEELAREAKFAKPQYLRPTEETDTRSLQFRKIHPDRDEDYRRWLRMQPCAIAGLFDANTGQRHVCWHPDGKFCDAAHAGKAYSGRLKRDDSGCIALCRHGHRLQESNMDAFDRRYGIDRHVIATRLYGAFIDEMERKGLR